MVTVDWLKFRREYIQKEFDKQGEDVKQRCEKIRREKMAEVQPVKSADELRTE